MFTFIKAAESVIRHACDYHQQKQEKYSFDGIKSKNSTTEQTMWEGKPSKTGSREVIFKDQPSHSIPGS